MSNKETSLQGGTAKAEALQIAEHLVALAGAATQVQEVDRARFVILPFGFQHMDITQAVEKALPNPYRKRGNVAVKDVASLLAYLADQAAADSGYVYADPDTRTMVAVLNDQRGTEGWRDHRVSFKAEYTPEFQRWLDNNGSGRAKDQMAFAEFIEDNMADLQEPFAQTLLDVATTIQATTGIEFKSARRLQDGQVQLGYVENVDARAGADGALTIPKEFTLGMRIFKNGEGYKLKARLKYRMNSGTVKFWYELDRPERAVEDAFAGYVNRVREQSGYQVLIGTP
jgi:uncharacterized protein YfdQ (DUF2303 family)